MNEFKTYHPIVNFTYFVCVIGFSMFLMHPVFLAISLFGGVMSSLIFKGKKETAVNLWMVLPLILFAALINPVFNHEGATILAYFPSGNPFTAESAIYAFAAATMVAAVIFHFSSYNEVMTSDKFVYLFGKVSPGLSLVLSMTLRFIPRFKMQLREIITMQKALGRDASSGGIIKRCRYWVKILSILITWSLENAVEVSDSMKSRGYGLYGRTAYSIFRFDRRDGAALLWILVNTAIVLTGVISGIVQYRYFPTVKVNWTGTGEILCEAAYLLLCCMPIIIEAREAYRWKSSK